MFLSSFRISGSAITAGRFRLDLIAENLANADSTRVDGREGPYRRKLAVFEALEGGSFADALADATSSLRGVHVRAVVEDPAPPKLVYDPEHPDAGADGYVRYPNVDAPKEMADLLAAQRYYELNANVLDASKSLVQRLLDLGRA
ncbi:MAG: Flagellar basal-body rod protein FlgC [Brockia lithotrophica]|uniref:Flagellar basal-body rod protein FlgC n=1 Tax=Brockia lithotrophica TaxID=933949 RepID=A0A2T5G901_9BACL|nr:flagellar basal body rod protein FlgC [Brockia lithotrophica]MBT9253388.1 flagellar basal body rod protein FlgC [Brockia lithotrophica]PTQ52673.1 MAG: Flagellar basal-body rod protein FlgC [Brockia lithotrophica]